MTLTDLLKSECVPSRVLRTGDAAVSRVCPYAGKLEFTVETSDGIVTAGKFLGQSEFEGGPHGATSGTFTLKLRDELDASDAQVVLDNATLNVRIETARLQSPAVI